MSSFQWKCPSCQKVKSIPKAFEGKKVKCSCGKTHQVMRPSPHNKEARQQSNSQDANDLLDDLAEFEKTSQPAAPNRSPSWNTASETKADRMAHEEKVLNETMAFHRDPRSREGFHGALADSIESNSVVGTDLATIALWIIATTCCCPLSSWVPLLVVGIRLRLQGEDARSIRFFIAAAVSIPLQALLAAAVWGILFVLGLAGFGATVSALPTTSNEWPTEPEIHYAKFIDDIIQKKKTTDRAYVQIQREIEEMNKDPFLPLEANTWIRAEIELPLGESDKLPIKFSVNLPHRWDGEKWVLRKEPFIGSINPNNPSNNYEDFNLPELKLELVGDTELRNQIKRSFQSDQPLSFSIDLEKYRK